VYSIGDTLDHEVAALWEEPQDQALTSCEGLLWNVAGVVALFMGSLLVIARRIFTMLAHYNRWMNQKLYQGCDRLPQSTERLLAPLMRPRDRPPACVSQSTAQSRNAPNFMNSLRKTRIRTGSFGPNGGAYPLRRLRCGAHPSRTLARTSGIMQTVSRDQGAAARDS
jgi:hypothetical protein